MSLNDVETQMHVFISALEELQETIWRQQKHLTEKITISFDSLYETTDEKVRMQIIVNEIDATTRMLNQELLPNVATTLEQRLKILRSYLYDE
jgi:soluble cytochrome b562